MPKEFIVAIELGSSKMTGIAGQKNLDGSITVLALVEEDSSSCIRKGVIYNIDKTCQCLTSIINKLQTTLKQDITKVYVGVGGRSIRSVKNVIVKDYPENTLITKDMIDVLMDIAPHINADEGRRLTLVEKCKKRWLRKAADTKHSDDYHGKFNDEDNENEK